MKNNLKVQVEGKNINNYIKWLIKNKIEIIKLEIINRNKIEMIINYKYFSLLSKYSKTYKISIIKKYGKNKIINDTINNFPIIISIISSIAVIYILSNIIFSVKILYNDKTIIKVLEKELNKYDIVKYHKKKSQKYLNYVKAKILENNSNILEWIEIEEKGTKYIIRIVERKKQTINDKFKYQSIVAKKDAIITSIIAFSGEKAKNTNQYIKKGEVGITGILTKPNGENVYTKASGIIEGEVWYKIKIDYPLYYMEEKITGNNKNTLVFNFLNNEIPLLPYKKYKTFQYKKNSIFENNIVPIGISKNKIYETNNKSQIYTPEEATNKAIEMVKDKLTKGNNNIKKIIQIKTLNQKNLNSKIELEFFVSVIEDITDIKEIVPIEEN